MERRLLAVHAHPDDESSKGAGMMAKYAQIGRVRVVTCTGGERGDILNSNLDAEKITPEQIGELRREEMKQAALALGIEHVWLGYIDSGLPEGDPLPPLPEGAFASTPIEPQIEKLVKEIREFRPQVITCYDENGGYPHPDHIRAHQVAVAAMAAAADENYHPELGTAWQVSKLYYDVSFHAERIMALHKAMIAEGLESPFAQWIENRWDFVSKEVHAKIEVAKFFPQRDAALLAHATQIDPNGFFFAVPRDIEARVWSTEEFHLAQSLVGYPAEGEIESDLFARIDVVA
ncbi:MAG: mycothiol conjugate amidase Mca [Arcanobacterium sp.]|nr:mycothiol conjugate amidase Mca [Arcanobacterium sp.]